MKPTRDVKEVEDLMDDLKYLQKQMVPAIANWRSTRPNCDLAVSHMSKGILRDVCLNPVKLNQIFDGLIKWLSDYILKYDFGCLKLKRL